MPLPLDGIENKYSVRKGLPLGEGVSVCWMLSYLVRLSAMGCCFCSELYKAKFAMPYREGGCVSALSIEPKTAADAKVESYLKRFERRVEAAPPGQCPLATVASYLETGANQTCGKCVPCRDGLPKLSELMRELAKLPGKQRNTGNFACARPDDSRCIGLRGGVRSCPGNA